MAGEGEAMSEGGQGEVVPGGSDGLALEFPDVESLQDLGTFAGRARTLMAEGSVRLQAHGTVLAAWVCVLPGRGLIGQGVVLGLRTMPLVKVHGAHDLDATVPLAAIGDRMARRASTGDVGTTLPVPPMQVSEPWTALTPARSGWEPIGTVPADELLEVARDGIAEISEGAPEGSGALAVAALRERVWGRSIANGALPAGVGLGAYGLGFAQAGGTAQIFRSGPWTRVTTPVGHLLTR